MGCREPGMFSYSMTVIQSALGGFMRTIVPTMASGYGVRLADRSSRPTLSTDQFPGGFSRWWSLTGAIRTQR